MWRVGWLKVRGLEDGREMEEVGLVLVCGVEMVLEYEEYGGIEGGKGVEEYGGVGVGMVKVGELLGKKLRGYG